MEQIVELLEDPTITSDHKTKIGQIATELVAKSQENAAKCQELAAKSQENENLQVSLDIRDVII